MVEDGYGDRFQIDLGLGPDSRVLEVASGSGGPGLFLVRSTGCRVVGIDIHEGQRVVVGNSGLGAPGSAIILVLSAKVVD